MASQQAHHLTNNVKRLSFFGNPSSEQVNHNVPFKHYAIIYLDEEGRLGSMSSTSIQGHISTVFTSEVFQDFLTAVCKGLDFGEPVAGTYSSDCATNHYPADDFDTLISDNDDSGNNVKFLRIGETQKITNYYESALKYFQQLNCCVIAKAFIKFIEPRKQVKHPYNGGRPSPGSGSTGDPEKTKPGWWPPAVMHKEPDHLRREYRIQLLLHLIRKLKDRGITADKLKEVAEDSKRSLKHPSHIEIILEILRIRKMEERFEDGYVGCDTLVKVVFHGSRPKGDDDEGPTDSPDVMTKGTIGQNGEDLSTPNYSNEQPTTSPPSINTMSMPAYSTPENRAPLIFESQQGCHSYITPTRYQNPSSQSVRGTQVTAEVGRTHKSLVSGYQPQNPFPISTPNQPSGEILSPYDASPVPSFLNNAVGNNTRPSPLSLPQPSIPCGYLMESSSRLHAVNLHGQSSEDPIGVSRPFHISSGVACNICYPSR